MNERYMCVSSADNLIEADLNFELSAFHVM